MRRTALHPAIARLPLTRDGNSASDVHGYPMYRSEVPRTPYRRLTT